MHTVPRVRFLCEQKGPFEAILTEKLAQGFAENGLVMRAYLVRIGHGTDPVAQSVVLAIRTKVVGAEQVLLSGVNA